jgi:hypothetical protein
MTWKQQPTIKIIFMFLVLRKRHSFSEFEIGVWGRGTSLDLRGSGSGHQELRNSRLQMGEMDGTCRYVE